MSYSCLQCVRANSGQNVDEFMLALPFMFAEGLADICTELNINLQEN